MPRGRPRKYPEKVRYIISVLWLHGFTEQSIANTITRWIEWPMTKDAVKGQIAQTPFRGRDQMAIEQRQQCLDELKKHRLDGGILPGSVYEAT